MTTPALQPTSRYGREWSWRQRVVAFVISLLVNLLILWILLTLAPHIAGVPGGKGTLSTFNVSDNNNSNKAASKAARAAKAATSQTHKSSPVPQPVIPPPIPLPPRELSPFIELSQNDFKKSDIGKIASSADDKGQTASAGGGAGDSPSAGSGPNGEPLYAAEWYRKPTDAEINGYMPKRNLPEGAWADIACKTMPRFHVDECVALEDSPPGYGLARAIQQAGWQFLVRPPRVGGKTMVGTWVRIHIAFYNKGGGDGGE